MRLGMTVCTAAAILMAAAPAFAQMMEAGAKMTPDGLVDSTGKPLYFFARDTTPGKSACNGGCTTAWPPMMATATDKNMGDWTVITRDDGGKQWAYKGHPLYTYAKDTAGGAATGVSNNWPRAK